MARLAGVALWLLAGLLAARPSEGFMRLLTSVGAGGHIARRLAPTVLLVPLALGFYGLFHLVIGNQSADLFACGFLAGYLAYDMTHYALHHYTPKSRFGKRLREYSPEEIGQFQVITDVMGGFSYTQDLSLFMEKTLGAQLDRERVALLRALQRDERDLVAAFDRELPGTGRGACH